MKDLYRLLEIASTSNSEEIRLALKQKKSNLSVTDIADVRHVLLDPKRREKYDHVHKTAQCIVDLREKLEISEASGFNKSKLEGFDVSNKANLKKAANVGNLVSLALSSLLAFAGVAFVISGFLAESIDPKYEKPKVSNRSVAGSRSYNSPQVQKNESARDTNEIEVQKKVYIDESSGDEGQGSSTVASATRIEPEVETGSLEMPTTGVLYKYDQEPAVAPLSIVTRTGSGNYFIKILKVDGSRLRLSRTAFIRDGKPLIMKVPTGDYEIRYASGNEWFGFERLFGRRTSYAKADEIFSFRRTIDGYSGFTIELYEQLHGNLETETLTADEF